MQSVLGTILDPAADKMLMTTLTVTLAMKEMIPGAFCGTLTESLAQTPNGSSPACCNHTWQRCPVEFGSVLDSIHFATSTCELQHISPIIVLISVLRKHFDGIGIFRYCQQKFDRRRLARYVGLVISCLLPTSITL